MGGMQKHSRLFTEYVAKAGLKVLLYHYIPSEMMVPSDDEVRKLFSEEANSNLTIRTFHYPSEDKWPGHYLRGQKSISKLYFDRLKSERVIPKLIFCKGFMAWEVLKRRDELPVKTLVAVKFHGMNMFQPQPDWKGELTKWLFRSPVRWIMNSSDFVFSYGGGISRIIAAELKRKDRIVEFRTGIDSEWVASNSEAGTHGSVRKFLFVGRLDRLKGLPELYATLKSRPELEIELTVVGPIPSVHQIDDGRISYEGAISDVSRMMEIYRNHDVLVCPSISEGMPNVILEAMSQGLPVIATDVGATALLVDDETGWLIKPKDVNQLAGALKKAANSSNLEKMGMSAIERVRQNHEWVRIASSFKAWYEKEVTDDLA